MTLRLRRWLWIAMCCAGAHDLFVFAADKPRHYYAAPDGSPTGNGSREKPWDIRSALSAGRVRPGDTIWLREIGRAHV